MRIDDPSVLEEVSVSLKAMADPTRLRLLQELMEAERTVSELIELVGTSQGNISKHLAVLKRAHLSPTESTAFETLSSPADNMFFDPTTAGTFSSMTSPLRSATLDAGRLTTLSAPGDMLALLLGSTNPGGFASSRGIARPRGLTVAPPFFGTAAGGKSSPCHSFTFARPAMGC